MDSKAPLHGLKLMSIMTEGAVFDLVLCFLTGTHPVPSGVEYRSINIIPISR